MNLVVDVTPRLMAYFEVTILEQTHDNTSAQNDDECVAIGLSTLSFHTQDNMPGWDNHSYGYHGDDGAIFRGGRSQKHGPPFGPGDTVGCGLEYSGRKIFFVRNGEFLGYAFKRVGKCVLRKGLYPTVGVDTKCPLFVNFGERPFRFDLRGFIKDGYGLTGETEWRKR